MAETAISVAVAQLNYIWNYKSILATLQSQLLNLQHRRDEKQSQIVQAERNGDHIFELTQNWLDRANTTINEAQGLIEHNNRLNMQCFKNLCPNLKKRYVESKQAVVMMEAVSKLYDEGAFDTVSYPTLPAETWVPDGYEYIASRQSTLDAILVALRADYVKMVGVYGTGGSGKTTMVREVAKIAEEDRLFNKVVFVEVTDTVDIRKIQKVIAERLGSDFREDSECVIADRIKQESKILLILDNIWNDLDLGAVGIPFGNNHMGCKLLLTSRDVNVLKEMGSKNNFPVDVLQEEEACNLFMKISGVGEEQRDLQALALEVAKECEGLLVAIVTIAKALRKKEKNEWKIALEELRNPPSIENVEESVVKKAYASIHLSYKHLQSQMLRSIFLLCIMMVSMDSVSIEELFRYTVGLSLFKAIAMEGVRERVKRSVQKLKDASLLLGTPNGETFSIHDVVHDVGRWIASNEKKYTVINDVVPRFLAAENALESCTSIILHNIVELPKSLKCPRLKFFYMKTKSKFTKVPDEFFKGMLNLEVLHLIEIDLSIVPRSLCLLKHLRALNLDECCVGDIAEIKDMEKLEILVIGGVNKIKQLPEEISQLTSLKLLDLRESSFIVPPKTISRLTQLEELYMDDWYGQQQVEELDIETGVASLEELKDLYDLTTLHIFVADAEVLPKSMVFEKLKRYKIVIGNGDNWSICETLRTLRVTSDTNLCSEDGVIKQLKGIEDLLLDGEQRITNVLCELDGEGFPKLKHFQIRNNPFILCIVDSMLSATCVAFPLLETMSLRNLVRLEKICHDQLRTKCFCQLRSLEVQECHKLKNLFPFSIAKHFSVLEKIQVVDCGNIEEIFIIDRADNGVIDLVFFQQLHSLTLEQLPRLRRICSEMEVGSTSQERQMLLTTNASSSETISEDQLDALPLISEKVVFPNLENLELRGINLKRIWPNQLPLLSCWVQNLTRMLITKCSNLKYVLLSSTLGSFKHLQDLLIIDCKDLEELIRIDDRCSNYIEFSSLERLEISFCPELREFIFNDMVVFPNLKNLELRGNNLKRIWPNQLPSLSCWVQLTRMSITKCSNLRYVFSWSTLGSFNHLQDLLITDCKDLEELIRIDDRCSNYLEFPSLKRLEISFCPELREFIFSNKVSYPNLQEILISEMKNLRRIWQSQVIHSVQYGLKLCKVELRECENLEILFPASIAKSLLQLEVLKVTWCGIKEIVAKEGGIEEAVARFSFPQLTSLHLLYLEELRCFYPGKHTTEWPRLKELDMSHCEKVDLMSFQKQDVEGQLDDGYTVLQPPLFSVQNLTRMSIKECNNLKYVFLSSTLGSFNHLQYLEINDCKDLEELIRIDDKFCNYVEFPSLEKLVIFRCSELREFIFSEKVSYPSLQEIQIYIMANLRRIWQSQVIQSVEHYAKLCKVRSSGCKRLENIFPASIARSLLQLEVLSVEMCGIKAIVSKEEGVEEAAARFSFPQLTSLSLYSLEELRSFYPGEHITEWPKLKELKVENCEKIDLFSFQKHDVERQHDDNQTVQQPLFSVDQAFSNLEELTITNATSSSICIQNLRLNDPFPKLKFLNVSSDTSAVLQLGSFEKLKNLEELELSFASYVEIFSFEEVENHVGTLAQLKSLHLIKLDNLKHIWEKDSNQDSIFQKLESLQVNLCDGLICLMPPSAHFENLKILKASGCCRLTSLVASSTTESSMQQARSIKANRRDVMEGEITFSKLKSLELEDLTNLISFHSGNYILNFPSLEDVMVTNCPKMKIFSSGVVSTPRLKEVCLDLANYNCVPADLNTIIQEKMICLPKNSNMEDQG